MLPGETSNDRFNAIRPDVIFSGDAFHAVPLLVKFSNDENVFIVQFRKSLRFAVSMFVFENVSGMKHVFGTGASFKIFNSVVGFISALVIDFILAFNQRKKCFRDRSSDVYSEILSLFGELRDFIAIRVDELFENSPRVVASNSSVIRYAVKGFIIRNWLPDFAGVIRRVGHRLIHSKFCSSLRERINAFGGQLLYRVLALNERQII